MALLVRDDGDSWRIAVRGWQVTQCAVDYICDGPILVMASVSLRTSWYDSRDGGIVTNDSSLPLYRPIISRIRKPLSRPMWAYGVQGGPAKIYRDLGYSQGVVEWLQQGGDIRQEGVANVRYLIEPP